MDSLSGLHWKKRVVLVFGMAGDPQAAQQIDRLAGRRSELADRDMLVIRIAGQRVDDMDGKAIAAEAGALRTEAGVGDGFAVVLVGKDGGVKYRSHTLVDDDALFGLVDRMPMRQAEMGRKP